MPIYRTQVFYARAINEKWTNVYHIEAAGLADAASAADTAMTSNLLAILNTTCTLVKYLVSDPTSAAFIEVPKNEPGVNSDGGSLLPLFNSVKARYPTDALGRPDYKFYKGYLTEDSHAAGMITSGSITTLEGALSNMLADMVLASGLFVSHEGDTWSDPVVQPEVQMRQMHRKRKKIVVVP
jgi:hypothetical protein